MYMLKLYCIMTYFFMYYNKFDIQLFASFSIFLYYYIYIYSMYNVLCINSQHFSSFYNNPYKVEQKA
jgi:hypothetical protein